MSRHSAPPPARAGAPVTEPTGPALRVLLVDDGAHHVALIRDELTEQGHVVVGVVDSAVAIHDCVQRLQPDVVIVDAESPSRDTLEHLATISASHPRPVVVFSEDASDAPMRAALHAGVSAYVIDGLRPQRIAPVLRVAIARFEQERALRAELEDVHLRLSERKLIDRAKGLLMDEIGLTEQQAHAHLRKLAMNHGQRLAQAAERVIAAQGLMRPGA